MIDASAIPETPVKPMLVATNQGDRDLSIIDPVAAKQLATVPEGGITGHEVATSPDGRTAYVPIYGSSGVGKPGTDGHEMVVIDIPSRTVTGKVDFGHGVRPHCPVYDRASGMLYVTTELDQTVTIIDPKTLKIVGTVPTGQKESHMLVISRDGQARLHLERGRRFGLGAGFARPQDHRHHSHLVRIPTHRHLERRQDGLYLGPDQAATGGDRHRYQQDQDLGAFAGGRATERLPRRMAASCWSTLPKANQLAVVDLASLKVVRTVDVPDDPVKVLARPDGKVAYVSCSKAQAGRSGRSVAVEGRFADRCRQGRRWPGLGGAGQPCRSALQPPEGARDAYLRGPGPVRGRGPNLARFRE